MATATAPAAAAAPAAQLTHKEILLVFSSLMLGMLLAAMDQTVLSTALPTIVGELSGLERLSWVVTSYLLTSTISVPLYGKLSDLYGRKPLFQCAIVIFIVGSALAGGAQTMTQLIVFRGIQGLGGGGLQSLTQAIIADIVSPRERGRYVGYTAGIWAAASVGGPLLGGVFTDHLGWRWLFFINLPLGALAMVVTARVLRLPNRRLQSAIDYLGAALIIASSACIMLAVTWGGNEYAWGSATIVSLIAVGIVTGVAFVLQELRAKEPLLPLRLFRNGTFTVGNGIGIIAGMSMFGCLAFLPLYLQVVKGVSATTSGLHTSPLVVSLVATVVIAGRAISRSGRYRVYPIFGTGMVSIALVLLSRLQQGSGWTEISLYLAVLGIGMGLTMQVLVIAVQNSVGMRDMGVATASVNFFRSMGGALGVALFGAILSNRLDVYLPRYVPPGADTGITHGHLNASPAQLHALPEAVRTGVEHAFSLSVTDVFFFAAPISVLAFALSWLIKEIPLRHTVDQVAPEL